MKLLSVPNIPNYQVDIENGVVYKLKYGRLKEEGFNLTFDITIDETQNKNNYDKRTRRQNQGVA